MGSEEGPKLPLSNDELPAAFWDAMPSEDHPDLQAINALKEEDSPDERAETLKVHGNDAFKRGIQLNKKFFLKEAIQKYTEALEIKGWQDKNLRSALFSNRSQAHLRIENNRHALEDALEALDLDSSNTKAVYRGASAASRLKQFEKAEELIGKGLKQDPEAPELRKLQKDVSEKAKVVRIEREKEAARQLKLRAPSRKLASTLLKRGWKVGAPQMSVDGKKPFLDEAGMVHWPLLFIYPEVMQNDVVQDATETDTLKAHLDVMFGPDAPLLEWDTERHYTRSNLEIYYFSHAAKALPLDKLTEALYSGWPPGHEENAPDKYGDRASKPVWIKDSLTVDGVLRREDYVVPGIPIFFLLARGTTFRDRFLERAM